MSTTTDVLAARLRGESYRRLMAIENEQMHRFVADAAALCEPDSVWVSTDAEADLEYTREMAIRKGEEISMRIPGHTVHFDGVTDQGRDREVTRYLVPRTEHFSTAFNQMERDQGLAEVRGLLAGSMHGRTMIVRFMLLGPARSAFSIPCVEITDSFYVSHSLNLLYRPGYDEFKRLGPDAQFFATLHSSGALDDRAVSAHPDKRRIYIDYTADTVYAVNTQYGGNSIGLKKPALRLAIRKADREGWLAEHMFLMGVHGPGGRKTYFAGAFPSACGKTSTAMLPGERILGDDIAYFRAVDGVCRAANAEVGIFGIIQNINAHDDPVIWDVLTKPGEVVFSNVLVSGGRPYWLGMGEDIPQSGVNFSGEWQAGKKDAAGNDIPPAHKNARYAVSLRALRNCDSELDNPDGVELAGVVYGGRDAKVSVPCQQSFDWEHGIVAYGASLESETTFAVLGREGVPEINLMSIQDFLSIHQGQYVGNNLAFGKKLRRPPLVFGVNYFLRDSGGEFLNGIRDKHVWMKWMELRVHGEVAAIVTPTGYIPCYEDLARLFKEVLGKDYARAQYVEQFSLRVAENLAKIERVEKYHHEKITHPPEAVFRVLNAQRQRLLMAREEFGDPINPDRLPRV